MENEFGVSYFSAAVNFSNRRKKARLTLNPIRSEEDIKTTDIIREMKENWNTPFLKGSHGKQ